MPHSHATPPVAPVSTVLGGDLVLVMEGGRLAEAGAPRTLMHDPDSRSHVV